MSESGDNQDLDSTADNRGLDKDNLPASTRSRIKLSGGTLAGGLPPPSRKLKRPVATNHKPAASHSDTDSDGFQYDNFIEDLIGSHSSSTQRASVTESLLSQAGQLGLLNASTVPQVADESLERYNRLPGFPRLSSKSVEGEESEAEDTFDDAEDNTPSNNSSNPTVIDNPGDNTETEPSSITTVQEEASTMTQNDANHHLRVLMNLSMVVEDDINPVDTSRVTVKFLENKLELAEEWKSKAQESILFFMTTQCPQYTKAIADEAKQCKRNLVEFIKEAQEVLHEGEKARGISAAPGNDASRTIKMNRVTEYQDQSIQEMNQMAEEVTAMAASDALPTTDTQYRKCEERLKTFCKTAEALLSEAKSLYDDAVDAGMEESAVALETSMRGIRTALRETQSALQDRKQTLGVYSSGHSKLVDIKPPQFTGDRGGKLDYYSFVDEFNEYISTKSLTESEKLRVLTRTCLAGTAQTACSHMQSIQQVWIYLKDTYGNPRILVAEKTREIKGMGRCEGSDIKKREWALNVKSKLTYLIELAKKHDLENEVYHSNLSHIIRSALPTDLHNEVKKKIRQEHGGHMSMKAIFNTLVSFMDTVIEDLTLDVNLNLATAPEPENATMKPRQDQGKGSGKQGQQQNPSKKNFTNRQVGNKGKSGNQSNSVCAMYKPPVETACKVCSGSHTHLYYCPKFIECNLYKRYKMTGFAGVCFRCLRQDSSVDWNDREGWFASHLVNCTDEWACKQGRCEKRIPIKQYSFILCTFHVKANKGIEEEFLKKLDKSQITAPVKFFFTAPMFFNTITYGNTATALEKYDGWKILPDIEEPSIYLLQYIQVDEHKLLCFYDSGCMQATISRRAADLLDTQNLRQGPTYVGVAGGETLRIDGGDERFTLPFAEGKIRATITGLCMPHITSKFPLWSLTDAYADLKIDYESRNPGGQPLPQVPPEIGKAEVDIMLGIRYNAYFPELVHIMPSGLAIYKSKFLTPDGNSGILGGPHAAWQSMIDSNNVCMYLTAEALAFRNFGILEAGPSDCPMFEPAVYLHHNDVPESDDDLEPIEICEYQHCDHHQDDKFWRMPDEWDIGNSKYSVKETFQKMLDAEAVGSDSEYRCVVCRNCTACKKSEVLESISLKEETEQYLIESCVEYLPELKVLIARLPFIMDPESCIKPNDWIAERVLKAELRAVAKDEQIRKDVVASHEKLLKKGHVIKVDDLPDEIKAMINSPGLARYVIPWRVRFKHGSLSTPVRMVFDGSSKTPNGESLNNALAKGQNKLSSLLNLLLKFRTKACAFTADISMAYNGVKLHPEHFRFQLYLWKPDLDPDAKTDVMVVQTLIYGIRPSGNLMGAAFEKLADFVETRFPEHKMGARVLRSAYVDDLLVSEDTIEECVEAAESLKHILGEAGCNVKAITISGSPPPKEVTADGKHVGLVGMLWNPEDDLIGLDIKPLYLGKCKRGKLPEIIEGDIGAALKGSFNRRTLVGKVAGVYDTLGLLTPVTARLKLDLHDLCAEKLDWDTPIPEKYLQKWVRNLEDIQQLREIRFRRTVIPSDAASLEIELICSSDASQEIAVATVHSRIKLKSGGYHCQLLAAKSKLVSSLTIPRAELKAAVISATLGHVAKMNLKDRLGDCIYVTDSSIVMFWISQDQRPLHTGVRNGIIEIRRLSDPNDWYHVDSEENIADTGTRSSKKPDLSESSPWQRGLEWMSKPRDEMKLKTREDIILNKDERSAAAQEMKAPDVHGIHLTALDQKRVTDHYAYSNYVVDPNSLPWPKSVRAMAFVLRFVLKTKSSFKKKWFPADLEIEVGTSKEQLTDFEVAAAENYFFFKATLEMKQFGKEKDWKTYEVKNDGILYYPGRIMDGQEIGTATDDFWDVNPMCFVRPVATRHSPVSYSVMGHAHVVLAKHRNVSETLLESRYIVYITKGRNLADEIRENCVYCRRYRAKQIEVEMGKIHPSRLFIAPAFYYTQVDLFGPMIARCPHNHRSSVKVYGVVFKDPSSSCIAVHCMQQYTTEAFLQAFTRFGARYCYPHKLFIDQGSQLMKAAKDMEICLVDAERELNVKYRTGIEYECCPAADHSAHGVVERSIKEVKKLYLQLYDGLKLDIMSYETAFLYIANELNQFPICLGNKTSNLGQLDVITPSRLLLGRNNRRAMGGYARVDTPSRLMTQLEDVFKAWWKIWKVERILDYIPQPPKWNRNNGSVEVGDIVIFLKSDAEYAIGNPVWKQGRIKEVERSEKDGLVRFVTIEYQNYNEEVWRTTRRSVRKVAVLHREGQLELVDWLNESSKLANQHFIRTTEWLE